MGSKSHNSPAPDGATGEASADLWVDSMVIGNEKLHVLSYPLESPGFFEKLTPAEREVVRHALAGRSNREIAQRRSTSTSTVSKQLSSVYRKLDVSSRHQLVALFFEGFDTTQEIDE